MGEAGTTAREPSIPAPEGSSHSRLRKWKRRDSCCFQPCICGRSSVRAATGHFTLLSRNGFGRRIWTEGFPSSKPGMNWLSRTLDLRWPLRARGGVLCPGAQGAPQLQA